MDSYLERFEHVYTAQRILDSHKRVTLLTLMGSEAYETVKETFARELLAYKTCEEIKAKLKEKFDSKSTEIVGRYTFHLIKQTEIQTISGFVRVVKQQVIKCECGEFRDQFVLGLSDEAVSGT